MTTERDVDRLEASLGPLPAPVERPGLVVLSGLPGAGKSRFAREVARRYPAVILDIDALRQTLFARPKHTLDEHARLFPAVHALIDRLLARGIPVIVDATNLREDHRAAHYEIAGRRGVKVVLVRVWAPKSVVRKRLEGRGDALDPDDRSTATFAVYEKMAADAEPIRRRHVSVNTSKETAPAVDRIVALLQS